MYSGNWNYIYPEEKEKSLQMTRTVRLNGWINFIQPRNRTTSETIQISVICNDRSWSTRYVSNCFFECFEIFTMTSDPSLIAFWTHNTFYDTIRPIYLWINQLLGYSNSINHNENQAINDGTKTIVKRLL